MRKFAYVWQSQLTTHNSQLTTHNSQLTTHNSQLTTKAGFTLVELSIALVIVGLLIGGILVGQSLIESAKINSQIRQIQQFDIAAETFRSKFKNIAGESGLTETAWTSTSACTSFKNSISDEDCQNNTFWSGYENKIYWLELVKLTDLKIESCPTLRNSGNSAATPSRIIVSGSSCNTPEAKLKKNLSVFVSSINLNTTPGNYYYIGNCSNTIGPAISCYTDILQEQAMAYDKKIDDGIPNTGSVQGGTRAAATYTSIWRGHFTFASSYDVNSANTIMLMQELSTNK